jgi:hypothetical protein
VYDELRRLAAPCAGNAPARPSGSGPRPRAYLRLARAGTPWHDERHFVGIARDRCARFWSNGPRAREALGGLDRVSLSAALVAAAGPESTLPSIDEALGRLEAIVEQAKIVELRYFVGRVEDAAAALGLSPATLAPLGRARGCLRAEPRSP